MKFLKRHERDFNVCSDCAYFEKGDPIDERYPEIVYGFCNKFEKAVDNKWETDCEKCTYGHTCEECTYYNERCEYDKDEGDYVTVRTCEFHCNDEIDENNDVCKDFESYHDQE